jgi:hypothetical protein
MRQEILAQRHDQLVGHAPQIEPLRRRGIRRQPPRERLGDSILGKISEIALEALHSFSEPLAEGEDLLELVEHQHRGERVVLLVPKLQIRAVQILPERFARVERGGIDVLARNLAEETIAKLLDQPRRLRTDIQTHVDGQVVLLTQPREETRLQQRGLAETRLAEEHRERRVGNAAEQILSLRFTAMEVIARALLEGLEPRPRIVPIELGGVHHASLRRMSRMASFSALTRPSSGSPPGACPQ